MSCIDDLIAEHCPDGVRHISVGDLGVLFGGLTGKTKKDFTEGNARYLTYTNVFHNIAVDLNAQDFVKVAAGESQREVQVGDVIFTGSSETAEEVGMSSVVVSEPESLTYLNSFCFALRAHSSADLNPEFAKHLFRSTRMRRQIQTTANGVTRFNISKEKFRKLLVPVPPMSVQREIAAILNKFVALEAELEAELEVRRQQYEYYCDTLLTFKELTPLSGTTHTDRCDRRRPRGYDPMSRIDDLIADHCPEGVEFKSLAEVSSKGTTIRWSSLDSEEFEYIDLSSVDRRTHRIGETTVINRSNAPSRAQQVVRFGDVIFATTRPAQMRWAVIPPEFDGQIVSTGYCIIRPDQTQFLTTFAAHLLGTNPFRRYVEANQVEGNYPSIPDSRVRAFRVPVPPMSVQREIAAILDKFVALEAELEAELEARRQQYEYYRDKLLTFKELTP